ncbi:hypothetical protein P12x_004855 [Tundrisphaera lichenicola]|uniref:hypothetical protein n=1 Tax=Tundrisphaera lichenicola TaxID=2029860 RepID=UPI003EBD2FD6
MNATQTTLGIGIYTPAEAAFYSKVEPKALVRWVFGNSAGKPVIERQLQDSEEKTVTFLDLVQVLAVREVRTRYLVPLQRIREGVELATTHYGLDYPLARKHDILLFGDSETPGHQQLVIRLNGDDALPEYIQLTGKNKGNRMLGKVVEPFLKNITFDEDSQLASQYRPMTSGAAVVLLDPTRRFGEPIIEPGGYTAEALWLATNVEGSFEDAASACGVSVEEVELANRYFDTLMAMKAA